MENSYKNIAIVGATGLVGRTFLKILEERNFSINRIELFASERSEGKTIQFKEQDLIVRKLDSDSFDNMDIALFSAGGEISKIFAPIAVKNNCIVIDNSSYWRMFPDVPLVVPEVNSDAILNHNGIIANPNCSTIQLVVALKPISDAFGLKRIVVSTYQSISGGGQKALNQFTDEIYGRNPQNRICNYQMAYNLVFHKFDDNGFTVEENKIINETRKILSLPELAVAATCVRVPVKVSHSISVNIETKKSFELKEIYDSLDNFPGIKILDNFREEIYPTPLEAENNDTVYIGRIRKDNSIENGFYLWVVADNVRKGAATNAVQIAEKLL